MTKMKIEDIAEQSAQLHEAVEELMMQQETPDIVYIAVFSRILCECLIATGVSREEAMEKLNHVYEVVEMANAELSTSIN